MGSRSGIIRDTGASIHGRVFTRRRLLTAGLLLTLGTGGTLLAQSRPTLFVFVPSLVRARALVDLLEDSLPDVEVVVFGRFADFMSAVETLRPSAALSLSDALKAIGLVADLRGTGAGGTVEPYVVVTHRNDVTLSHLGSLRLGMVDLVGRKALPELARRLLSLKEAPEIRRVLKIGDLLPLLSLNLADAIVIPERMLAPLRSASRQSLRVLRPPDALLGRTALAYPRGERNSRIQAGIQRLSQAALDALGIQGWESGK